MEKNKEKKSLEKERTIVPTFFSRQPLPLLPAQRFLSNPSVLLSPSGSAAIVPNISVPDIVTEQPSKLELPKSAYKKSKTPPGNSIKQKKSQKKKSSDPETNTYDYKLQPSPLYFPSSLNENILSPLMLEPAIFETNPAAFSAEEEFKAYKFIFQFSFGDAHTKKNVPRNFLIHMQLLMLE